MDDQVFQFDWDEAKAAANFRKHGVTFELASTVFQDPRLLTIADLEHSESEERWFSVGCSRTGVIVTIVYLWKDEMPGMAKIRLISARRATQTERAQYQKNL